MPHPPAFAILAGALCAVLVELLFLRRWYAYKTFESYGEMLTHFVFWLFHGFRYRYPDRRIQQIVALPNEHFYVIDKKGRKMPQYIGPMANKKLCARIEAARGKVPIRTIMSTNNRSNMVY